MYSGDHTSYVLSFLLKLQNTQSKASKILPISCLIRTQRRDHKSLRKTLVTKILCPTLMLLCVLYYMFSDTLSVVAVFVTEKKKRKGLGLSTTGGTVRSVTLNCSTKNHILQYTQQHKCWTSHEPASIYIVNSGSSNYGNKFQKY